jgi:serine/threonine-protein kinase
MDKVSSGKIGRYEIIKVLGRGGMGEVILAQDENLGRRVAIKRPFKSAVADGLARFQVEAKAATLRHPNIPAVYEMGVHDDLPFIAMEYVEGENLEKLIESRREIDLITKLKIIEQVCSALGYAHENGIIHRDIKPANIIVQPDGTAKIIDFGIAKLQDDDASTGLTKASQLIGSLYYIAPERFYGGKVDGRVDIFSAGVTLFKLLTGKEPFTGSEATASFKIMNESHTSLRSYLQDYPPALDEIVEKSLAKSPDDRYQTGEDFADALHEVIEELKRSRVSELFNDAERLTTERRFAPALELLDEAIKLDPANTQARKLRKFVREHQERIRRAERLRDCLRKSDEALLSGNYEETLSQLKDALNLDPASADIKSKIQMVEEKKRRFEASARALADAEKAKARGDVTGALRIITRALQEDPENKRLTAQNEILTRQMEVEAQRGWLLELLEKASHALAVRDYDSAEKLLAEATEIDPANLDTDKLRRELAKAKELEQRRAILEEIQVRVQEFIRNDAYDQAADLLNRALDKLPNEALLHRLKAEVDAEARKYDVRRVVDMAISQANELFASSPLEALSVVQNALDNIPGEERLVGYERSLRHQLETQRSEQLRGQTVLKARELMDGRQFDKAVGVLEIFQVEFGQQPDIDELLRFARSELAAQQRVEIVSRSMSEARTHVREGRLEEAARVLELAEQQTGDAAVSGLLTEVRAQQAAIARKYEALLKRVEGLRERGELDEAIQLLQEQLATAPGNTALQQLADSLQAERKRKQVTAIAMRAANEAVKQNNFAAALESLRAVVNAYGESTELSSAVQEVESKRATHAGEAVGNSIETARSALLKSDPQAALEALKTATPFLEFADTQKQTEWQRVGQAVKKALQQAGSTSSHAVFDQQLSEVAQAKPRRIALYAIAGIVVVVLAVAGIAVWKLLTPKPLQSSIQIVNVTPGAKIQIDGVPQSIDVHGNVNLAVKPGPHKIQISENGYKPIDRSLEVQGTFSMDGSLIPAGTRTGNLLLSLPPDLRSVNIAVDGKSKGEFGPNQPIELEVGTRSVTFTASGYEPSNPTSVQISESAPANLSVSLRKMAEPGTLTVHLQGDLTAVRVFANGRSQGEVRSNQKVTLAEGTYTLRFESLGFKPKEMSGVRIAKGSDTGTDVSLEKIYTPTGTLSATQTSIMRGDSVTLTWQTQNAPAAEISGIGQVTLSGTRQVSPTTTATYALTSNGTQLAPPVTIQVTERPILPPKVVKFEISPNPIESGHSATLAWQVENASSVEISELGTVPPSGTQNVSPSRPTVYKLSANGSPLSQASLDVREAREVHEPPKIQLPPKDVLEAALRASYDSVFTRASGKSTRDCQGVFNGAFAGKLHDYAPWCSSAKAFAANHQCGAVGGSPEAPTLACSETVTVQPKDGDPQQFRSQKTFHFTNGESGWTVNW